MSSQSPAAELTYDQARDAAVAAIELPDGEQFLRDFQVDLKIEELASVLIHHLDELSFISDFTVTYLWRRAGGKSKGKVTLGRCVKTSGLVHYFAQTDYVIWLAADHVNTFAARRKPVNLAALVYHELRHIARDDNGQPSTQGHEFEGFANEIERFGIWREDMKPVELVRRAKGSAVLGAASSLEHVDRSPLTQGRGSGPNRRRRVG